MCLLSSIAVKVWQIGIMDYMILFWAGVFESIFRNLFLKKSYFFYLNLSNLDQSHPI